MYVGKRQPQFREGKALQATETAPSPAYVTDFLATSDGLARTKAFMRIKNAKLKRRIVELVEEICRGSGTGKKARKKSRAFVISVEGGLNSPYRPCYRQA
jgi:hypothetical protein